MIKKPSLSSWGFLKSKDGVKERDLRISNSLKIVDCYSMELQWLTW